MGTSEASRRFCLTIKRLIWYKRIQVKWFLRCLQKVSCTSCLPLISCGGCGGNTRKEAKKSEHVCNGMLKAHNDQSNSVFGKMKEVFS